MQTFDYVIQDTLGIHARPAGILVKFSSLLKSRIEMKTQNGKTADLKKIFSVMGLGVKYGDRVTVSVEGQDEMQEAQQLEKFFQENL